MDTTLRDLQSHPGWALLGDLVARKRELLVQVLESKPDRETNAADYAYKGGQLAGLKIADELIAQVADTARRVREASQEGGDDA